MELTIYHGSSNVIPAPEYGKGKVNNDYGLGFYCTESIELAKEWACSKDTDGFVNKYHIETDGLSILNLSDKEYTILHWLAVLLKNREFDLRSDIASDARTYLIMNYLPDYEDVDIIIGYRADDSYFSFASQFLKNTISLEKLSTAMHLGKLGEQVVLKSKRAFSRLQYVESITAERTIYYPKMLARDTKARTDFISLRDSKENAVEAVYMIDILREGRKNYEAGI